VYHARGFWHNFCTGVKMKKKLRFALIILVSLLFILSSCHALDSWVLSSDPNKTYGDWEKLNRKNWKSESTSLDAQLWYDYDPSDAFALWDLKVKSNILIEGLGDHAHVLDFTFGNDTLWVQVEIVWRKICYAWLFGLFQGTVVDTGVYVSSLANYSESEKVWSTSSNAIFRVVMYRSANETLTVKLVAFANEDATEGVWSFSRNYTLSDACFANGYVTQIIGKHPVSGSIAYVEGQIWNEVLICDGSIISDYEVEGTAGFWEGVAEEIWNSLVNAWNGFSEWASANLGFLGDVWSYITFGLTFIVNLFQLGTQFFPMFIAGYGIYLLGLILICVIKGDPAPLWDHLLFLYQTLATVISMIMNVAETVYGYIKFW
jgi:hypothetical protein